MNLFICVYNIIVLSLFLQESFNLFQIVKINLSQFLINLKNWYIERLVIICYLSKQIGECVI